MLFSSIDTTDSGTIYKILLLVSFLFFTAAAVPAQSADNQRGGRRIAGSTASSAPLYKRSCALLIGNSTYTNGWTDLPGPISDIAKVEKTLKAHHFDITRKINVTKKEFERSLWQFIADCGRGKDKRDNRLLIYYAGHGYTEQMANGSQAGYLVMTDAGLPYKSFSQFQMGSVSMESIVTISKKIDAKHVLYLFDSCFSGAVLNVRGEPMAPEHLSSITAKPVRQFITSGSANEQVPDQSTFCELFTQILTGERDEPIEDGYLTGQELGIFLQQNLPRYTRQTPQYGKINDAVLDKGDFVFFLPEKKSTAPVSMTPATLTVITNPKEATIKIKDIAPSYRPGMGLRGGRSYTLQINAPGYEAVERKIWLKWGEAKKIDIILLPEIIENIPQQVSPPSTLTVQTVPADARVRILNIKPKYTPAMELQPGRYHLGEGTTVA